MSNLLQEMQAALATGDLETFESAWLAASDEATAVEPLVRFADQLARAGHEDRARVLLELFDSALVEREEWPARLDLLRGAAKHYVKSGRIFETVMDSVRTLYKVRQEQLTVLLPEVGLDRGKDETSKLWDRIDRLRSLMTYEVGTIVAMEGRGVGVVIEVNLALQSLRIELSDNKVVAVGFRAAAKMLGLLSTGHVLRMKVEQPETLLNLDPPALLRLTLESFGRPMQAGEIKAALEGVVPAAKWSSWWTQARKHEQVLSSPGSRKAYRWAESGDHAQDHLWSAFEHSNIDTKLEVYRRSAAQVPELQLKMAEELARDGQSLISSAPAKAFEVALVLERAGVEWDPWQEIAATNNPPALFAGLSQRAARERAYSLVQGSRDDWRDLLMARFPLETDAKALDTLQQALADGPAAQDRLVELALSQPGKAPALFAWLVERACENEAMRAGRGPRLMRTLLATFADPAFDEVRQRLQTQLEHGGLLPRLIGELNAEESSEALKALENSKGVENYQKRPLLTALFLRFPELEAPGEQPLWALPDSLAQKRIEMRHLLEEEIPANRKAIEEARAMGDLRENFEYKAARQRHEYLASRATTLHVDLARAKPLDLSTVETSEVRVGTRLVLSDLGLGRETLTLLGPFESAPERGVISYESELGQALLGLHVGDEVTVRGETRVIESISTAEIES